MLERVPALVALVQGVGVVNCVNSTRSLNKTLNVSSGFETFDLQAQYQPANFSAEVFFFFLSTMMLVCLLAFLLINHHPSVAMEFINNGYTNGVREKSHKNRKNKNMHAIWEQHLPLVSHNGCHVWWCHHRKYQTCRFVLTETWESIWWCLLCYIGFSLCGLCSYSVFCQSDHRSHPAWWGP